MQYSKYLQDQCASMLRDLLRNDEMAYIFKNLSKLSKYIDSEISTSNSVREFLKVLIEEYYYKDSKISKKYKWSDRMLKSQFGIPAPLARKMRSILTDRKIIKVIDISTMDDAEDIPMYLYEINDMDVIRMMVAYE